MPATARERGAASARRGNSTGKGTCVIPGPPRETTTGTIVILKPMTTACYGGHAPFRSDRAYDRAWSANPKPGQRHQLCAADIQYFVMRTTMCHSVPQKWWTVMYHARTKAKDVAGQAIVGELRSQYRAFVTAEWLQAVQFIGMWLGVRRPNCVRFAKKVAAQANIRFDTGYFAGVDEARVKVGMLRCALADCALALLRDLPHPQPLMAQVQEWIVDRASGVRRYHDGQVFLAGPAIGVKSWDGLLDEVQRVIKEVESTGVNA